LKSVKEMGEIMGDGPLPGNGTVERLRVREIGRKPRLVREGELESTKPVNFTLDYLKKIWDTM
jgi:hypothetical protein